MREMKESGLSWASRVPSDWDIIRGKNAVTKLKRPVKETDGVITCFRDGEVTLRSKRREEGFTFSDLEVGYQGIEPGDLVIHGMDGFAGAIGISDSRGKGTPVLNVLESKNDKRFLMYYFRAIAKCGYFESVATGIRVRTCDTNWNKIAVTPCLVPPPAEQSRIAAFLDDRCTKINEAIGRHKTLIEKLDEYRKAVVTKAVTKGVRGEREMKESGFERIGLIPSEWYYRPLKSIGRFYGGMSGKAGEDFKVEDGEAFTYFIPYTNIFNNFEVNPSILAKVKIKEGETQNCVHKGDLLFLMSSEDYAGLGQTSVMLYEIDNLWLNSFCKGLTNKSTDVDSKYLNYFLSSELIHDYIRVKGEGYTRINLKTSNLGMCPVFVPTPDEQSEIVAFLDKKCSAIDTAKERHQQLIAKLEEYKKSLIYNAVTGKIEC